MAETISVSMIDSTLIFRDTNVSHSLGQNFRIFGQPILKRVLKRHFEDPFYVAEENVPEEGRRDVIYASQYHLNI